MNKGKGIGIVAFVLLLVVIAVSYLSLPAVKTVKAVNTEYVNKLEFDGIYFTQEYVLRDGAVDKAQLLVKEGERIPKGQKLSEGRYSSEAGILGTSIDGYENKFNRKNILQLNLEGIHKIKQEHRPGLKIFNNSEWFVYAAVDKNETLKSYQNYVVSIGNATYPGDVVEAKESKDANYYLLKIKNDLDIINLHRNINGYIIKSTYNGIVIPVKAFTSLEGRTGVLIKINGYAEFRRAVLLFEDKQKDIAVIAPDTRGRKLYEYDEVIINPDGITDGTKIR